jgi:hypothetical protein
MCNFLPLIWVVPVILDFPPWPVYSTPPLLTDKAKEKYALPFQTRCEYSQANPANDKSYWRSKKLKQCFKRFCVAPISAIVGFPPPTVFKGKAYFSLALKYLLPPIRL